LSFSPEHHGKSKVFITLGHQAGQIKGIFPHNGGNNVIAMAGPIGFSLHVAIPVANCPKNKENRPLESYSTVPFWRAERR
jgi:hypothetical protein